jgi:hypothetical protein
MCSNLLVLEDDAFFENDTVELSTTRADAFLRSEVPYGLLLLGWNKPGGFGDVQVSKINGADCAFQLDENVRSSHAYVISNTTMLRFSNWSFAGDAIDVALPRSGADILTIRPMSVFQRYHKSAASNQMQGHDMYSKVKAHPDMLRINSEDAVYQDSGYGDLCAT